MNFGAPSFALLLFLLPLFALAKIAADARGQRALRAFASAERLRSQLVGGGSALWSSLHFGLQLLGLGFFILALTRPQLGEETLIEERSGRNLFLAIDTSKSMLAEDITPNRLGRSKLAAQDVLEKLPTDRVGVIAFAGRAYLQAPLTNDHEAVVETIQSLDHTTIPRGGSSVAAAIQLAIDTVDKVKGREHGMILFTDGQETDAATLTAAREAAKRGLLILPVGVGSAEGAFVPDPEKLHPDEFLRDEKGAIVKSRLEADLLREVAKITGGEYIPLASQALTQPLISRLMANLDRHKFESKADTRPIERYQWPLSLGILCIMASLAMRPSSRRRIKTKPPLPVDPQATVRPHPLPSQGVRAAPTLLLALTGMGVLMMPATVQAASERDLQRAKQAFDQGRFDAAKNAYQLLLKEEKLPVPREELAYSLGASQFHLKEYDPSVEAFSEALKSSDPVMQQKALRGLGTALYNRGDEILGRQPEQTLKAWMDSINHFDAALDRDQSNKELKANRDFILERIKMLKAEMERQKKEGEGEKQKKGGQGKGKGPPSEDGTGEGERQEGDQEGDEEEKRKTDALEKKQEALPEGELRAGEAGQNGEKKQSEAQGGDEQNKKNEITGFTPQQARDRLRTYANDQQSVQYLMRKEQAHGGKDY